MNARVALGFLLLGAACSSAPRACGADGARAIRCESPITERYVAQNQDRWRAARDDAATWLAALTVDPIALRAAGLKGKKHFVEALGASVWLVKTAADDERPAQLERARALTAITQTDAYHDMSAIDDLTFKQDATSYLRAAVLMEEIGLDTRRYREEIARIAPRLDAHMARRGVQQHLVFSAYYAQFGLKEPFPLAAAATRGVIAARLPVQKYTRRKAYDLTHEVFAPYHYGAALEVDPFSVPEKLYLRAVLPALVARQIAAQDPDLVAELVSCLRFLRFTDVPAYTDGLAYLLLAQKPDGSWGRAVDRRAMGPLASITHALHPTMVALSALAVAFHPAFNEDRGAWCPPSDGASVSSAGDAGFPAALPDAGDGAPDDEDEGSEE